MPRRERVEVQDGNVTGWRNALPFAMLPLACFAVYKSGSEFQDLFGKSAEDASQALSILIALSGLALRLALSGRSSYGRDLITDGPYSIVRHPFCVANFLILLGLSLSTQVLWFALVAALGFVVYYRGTMSAEAVRLETRYGERYRDWAAKTPAFLPNFSLWQSSEGDFSLIAALRREYRTLLLIIICVVTAEVGVDLRTGYATLASWPADWPYYFAALGLSLALYPVMGRTARVTPIARSEHVAEIPFTRGLRVDGRAGLVDTLENLISGGQQEAILDATLAAAEISVGDVLLDVGCGTGKLGIAAWPKVGPAGLVIGIDATPEMIELAIERARAARSGAEFRVGVAESLPFADGTVQALTSSYFFHHLPSEVKLEVLREMWRVLAPGGRLIITDYGKPRSLLGYIASVPMRFDFHEYVRPQLRGELEDMIADARVGPIEVVASFLGYINVLRLRKDAV